MNASTFTDNNENQAFEKIITSLETQGFFIGFSALPLAVTDALFIHLKSLQKSFKNSAIGRKQNQIINPFIRRDSIYWLNNEMPEMFIYWQWIENLRQQLNQRLFLGLFDYECHYAYYNKGAFYKKHWDAFKGNSNRVLTVIHYLTPNYSTEYGGELLIYAKDEETVLKTVYPEYGKTVIFLSEEFPHEVLPTHAARYSITGWFRVNNNQNNMLDSPVYTPLR